MRSNWYSDPLQPPRTILYEGFEIEARPFELQDGGWTTNIHVTRIVGGDRHVKKFSASNVFTTEDEAARHCLDFGRRIVDGTIPEFKADDLP